MSKTKRLYVWDFHGVLEEGNVFAVHEICNAVLAEFGVKREATVKECDALYGKKWADYYRYFAPQLDEGTIFKMVDRALAIQMAIIPKHIKPTEHGKEILESIKRAGHTNILMSNTAPDALDYFLELVGLSEMFSAKYAADRHKKNAHEGNSKEVWLKQYLSENKFEGLVLIDDSMLGVEMGIKMGARVYHYRKGLKTTEKEGYTEIGDLRELLKDL